jgi:uncharacterized protein (DUF433 family)
VNIDWNSCPAVWQDPNRLGGVWAFRNSRIPVSTLFENLEGGAKIDDFLEWFEGIEREQVEAVLEHVVKSLNTGQSAIRFS